MNTLPPRYVLVALSPELRDRTLEIGAFLERFGFQVGTAETDTETLAACGRSQLDAIVIDLGLVAGIGLDTWLMKLKLISSQTAPVVIGTVEQIDLLRRVLQADGDYVLLPLHLQELKDRVRRLVALRALEPREREAPDTDRSPVSDLVGGSRAMQGIRERIRKIAGLTSTVLITGESGVGKELIARAIHRASPRRDGPFIAINCSALPESLLETELFGHEKGAFTGATGLVKGKFELAHQGTLFLDEIGDMNPYTQAKILRVLEEKEFMRVGGARNIRVDVRLVAATNADLEARMADGRFRQDLFYRLRVLTIEVPPLRERAEDVPELVRAFIDRFSRANAIAPKRVTDEALDRLARHAWPGNVRELRNTLENLIATAPGEVITVDDMPGYFLAAPRHAPPAPGPPHGQAARAAEAPAPPAADAPDGAGPVGSMEEMERELIRNALAEVGGNRTRAARLLQIGVRTLQRKIKKYGLE